MNKKKLTLLIALSIILVIGIVILTIVPNKSEENIKPVEEVERVVVSSEENAAAASEEETPSIVEKTSVKPQVSSPLTIDKSSKPTKTESTTSIKETTASSSIAEDPMTAGKYPIAEHIWYRLTSAGINEHVAAGIMGNIMSEVGGHTLDFSKWKKWSSTSGTYGICQWTGSRRNKMFKSFGKSIDDQVDFLLYEMPKEFNSYGYKYKSGFDYDDFLALEDEQQAALAFAKCYERCSSKGYSSRKKQATKAYSYFTN